MVDLTKVLNDIVSSIVDDPSQVKIDYKEEKQDEVVLSLSVAPDDIGRVIGKNGKIAQAIRLVMRTAANELGKKVIVEIK